MTTRAPRPRRPTRTQLLLTLAFVVLVAGVVQGYVFGRVGSDERVLVASLEPGVSPEERERVRLECGGLPGVTPVADRGSGRSGLLERFPLRFSLRGATAAQESALQACLAGFDAVRGVTTEGRP